MYSSLLHSHEKLRPVISGRPVISMESISSACSFKTVIRPLEDISANSYQATKRLFESISLAIAVGPNLPENYLKTVVWNLPLSLKTTFNILFLAVSQTYRVV